MRIIVAITIMKLTPFNNLNHDCFYNVVENTWMRGYNQKYSLPEQIWRSGVWKLRPSFNVLFHRSLLPRKEDDNGTKLAW